MFNIFKRKTEEEPIYLDCYTYSHYAYNHAKIDYSRKYFPEWFKTLNKNALPSDATMKNCEAFTDYYSKGIVIPLWGELDVTVHALKETDDENTPIFSWQSSNEDFDLHSTFHSQDQFAGFGTSNTHNLKMKSPWGFKTTEPIHFVWGQPTWSQPKTFHDVTGLPAVIQFKSQAYTNINYMFEQKTEEQKFNFQPLTPIAMMHPMTERRVEIRNHLVSLDKYQKIIRRGGGMLLNAENLADESFSIAKQHSRKRKFWEKADELNKCPFT